jgi:hypothetical protein
MTSGPDQVVTSSSFEEVVAAIESIDLDAPWADVAPNLRIALPRQRPMPPGTEDLPIREYPPGIRANLGLDIGPAMLFVCHEQLADWGVSEEDAFDRALMNVRDQVRDKRQFALLHERIDGVPTLAFQSREGWASTLLLLPEELIRVLGKRSGLVLAPMRDLLLVMPLDTEPDFAHFIFDEFAAADMNALDVPLFSLVDGLLTTALAEPFSVGSEMPSH